MYERASRMKGMGLPAKQPLEKLDELIKITKENRKEYIKLGAVLWVMGKHYTKPYFDVLNVIPILPYLRGGYLYIKDYPFMNEIMSLFVPKGGDNRDEWVRSYDEVISFEIKEGRLYFDPEYKKVKWKFSKIRLTK